MPINTAQDKFIHELADAYDAEHQFLDAMRKMREKATDEKLKNMLADHIEQTTGHIKRLEDVFSETGEKPRRQPCQGAKGLIAEGTKVIGEAGTDELRDAFIAGAATKAEHYEMVAYAGLIDGAEMMKQRKAVRLLTQIRDEEVETARKLERVAPRLGKAAA